MAKQYIKKLRSKYRLIIYNDKSYAEVWQMRLSRLNVLSVAAVVTVLFLVAVISLIAFTPLREFIPGYPDSQTRRHIIQNALRLDSIEQEVRRWVVYNDNLERIISGQAPLDIEPGNDTAMDKRYNEIMLKNSAHDSVFRKQIEQAEQFNLDLGAEKQGRNSLWHIHLLAPTQGTVSTPFAPSTGQYGVGIRTTRNTVLAAHEGTVVAAYRTIDMNYVVHIQHDMDITTIYKNLQTVSKKTGSIVTTGEVIGMLEPLDGQPSELFFEIWYQGRPSDPSQYLKF